MTDDFLEPSLYRCASCGFLEPLTEFSVCSKCAGEQVSQETSPLGEFATPEALSFDTDLASLLETPSCLPIHRILSRYVQSCGITFSIGENHIEPINVFQPEAFMSVIALEAMRIWQTLEHPVGQLAADQDSLEANLVPTSSGVFPMAAYPPAIGNDLSSALRLLTFTLAARRTLGLKENTHIDLLPHLAKWEHIDWFSPTIPQLPIPDGFDLEFQHKEFKSAVQTHKIGEQPVAAQAPINQTNV